MTASGSARPNTVNRALMTEIATRVGIARQAAQQRWGAYSLSVACNPNENDSKPSYFAGRKAI